MAEKQRTIKKQVSLTGIGIHSGEETTITFIPAPENYGYRFVRVDLPNPVEIPALVDYVVDLSRGTTLGIDDVRVLTVEHVLAALVGLRIDNCRIELNGKEPPVIDGSSLPYAEKLLEAGIVEQNAEREYFVIDETVRYTNEEKGVDIVALPTDDYRITVMIDYNIPSLGSQHTGVFNLEKEFLAEFAPARTFCFLTEVEELYKQGLIKGGNLNNAIVIIDKELDEEELKYIQKLFGIEYLPEPKNGILNGTNLRFKNEPARHKLLDMLGDLALIGVPIKAQILAARPGHASNIEFAKKIRSLYLKKLPFLKLQGKKGKDALMDIFSLLKIMPHRYPFLLIDRILEIDTDTNTITGIKNVTINEPFFAGHFPEKPVMPGVLLIEALAQTGGLMLLSSVDAENKLLLFMGIDNAKFRKPVIPGDQLIMKVQLVGKKFNTYKFHGIATVNGQVVCEADLQAALVDRNIQL
ncbi:MAG: bifunctional UDP-3-O-[3-hydroxymyristoyl] N-acetylglucosamine deacetylase/3-hydroxyacyl-ACP dehydratase [Ignavibacteria bacterium]|nr:bifunctional UDP-3-O-[3-hydroxymyristoyl] N-acetylglucosamine deacetylase/3-hydroxyacyl-ACP dehydratase [Ignavibacteria bacterium]